MGQIGYAHKHAINLCFLLQAFFFLTWIAGECDPGTHRKGDVHSPPQCHFKGKNGSPEVVIFTFKLAQWRDPNFDTHRTAAEVILICFLKNLNFLFRNNK